MHRAHWDSLGRLLLAPALVLAVSCFEDPISEQLQLEFRENDRVAISLKVEISLPDNNKNRLLETRVRDMQGKLLRGDDDWARRFDLVTPLNETVKFQKVQGRLKTVQREALIEVRDLPRVFSDTGITVNMVRGMDWSELTVYAGKSKRATWQQQTLLSTRLDSWTSHVSAYLSTLAAVYGYLDNHPDRDKAVLGAVLKDEMPEEESARLPKLSEDEEKMVDGLNDRMREVWSVLLVDEDQAFSINEISSLVHDPFPANLTIRLPAKILERDGFETSQERTVRVPQLTLWGALPTMGGRWITPDPLVTRVETSRTSGAKKVNLQEFLAQERRVLAVPSAAEVKVALTERLEPRATYRVRWSEPDPNTVRPPG